MFPNFEIITRGKLHIVNYWKINYNIITNSFQIIFLIYFFNLAESKIVNVQIEYHYEMVSANDKLALQVEKPHN